MCGKAGFTLSPHTVVSLPKNSKDVKSFAEPAVLCLQSAQSKAHAHVLILRGAQLLLVDDAGAIHAVGQCEGLFQKLAQVTLALVLQR